MQTFRHYYMNYEKDPQLSFYVRSCGYFNLMPPDREAYRSCVDFGEIFWCIRGGCTFKYKLRESVLKPGYVWYYPVGSCHDYQPLPGGFEYRFVTIAGVQASVLFAGLNIQPGQNYAGTCPDDLFSLVELNLKAVPTRPSQMTALAAAFRILTMVSPGQHPEMIRGNMAEKAKSLIDSGFKDCEFNVGKVASLLGVHRGSLSRAFASSYGITVSHYITHCRVRHAMKLLNETDLSIHAIALQSGFSTREYFSRVFLEQTSFTPAVFRKTHF